MAAWSSEHRAKTKALEETKLAYEQATEAVERGFQAHVMRLNDEHGSTMARLKKAKKMETEEARKRLEAEIAQINKEHSSSKAILEAGYKVR